ncbi:MAG: hypothetical protein KY445_02480 [Armatimonadetes bacterium]|nr:hypothetical protein [Armatimonadota bacterium]
MNVNKWNVGLSVAFLTAIGAQSGCAQEQNTANDRAVEQTVRVPLSTPMLQSESELADFTGLVDEQEGSGDPPTTTPATSWKIGSQYSKQYPFATVIDMGQEKHLSSAWLYDTNGAGDVAFYAGKPGEWRPIATYNTNSYKKWVQVPLSATTRYLRVELKDSGANVTELILNAYTEAGFRAVSARLEKEKRERAEREAALRKAHEEVARRPVVEMAPFGKLSLVDEVDVGAGNVGHLFEESPKNTSKVETILGRSSRVLVPTEGESSFMSFRLGRFKLLKPGAPYVLAIEYPEDASRSWIVLNGGNETVRGFHTGRTTGDAFHPKYVNNLNESLNIPLSGRYETWKLFFTLHDRFPERDFSRGAGPRSLLPEDGFPVTIAQFSKDNIPASSGAAVARIRLYEVLEPQKIKANYNLPPAGLPQRHLFWREEMADGVLSGKTEEERGLKDRLDWYRAKARLMHFLGMNTYTKDLLEFGAVQHWDTSPLGGNTWAFHDASTKDLWGNIVEVMGKEGFNVLPYYEYAGSKGQQGLGNKRRAKPLTRDDGYTHIKWIENANVDITDPDAYVDFKKMLDLTVVRHKDKAKFAGIWIRPRSQMPISFAEATLARFADEANGKKGITREHLKTDKALLARYYEWWFGKRREFLAAMNAYLVENGIQQPIVLYTAEASEPGAYFRSWDPQFVTDDPAFWQSILSQPQHIRDGKKRAALTIDEVVRKDLYMDAMRSPRLSWGGWELSHANPESDPQRYQATPGILQTHPFNHLYTVASPKTLDAFSGPAGLALIRHYSLNENMLFDREDKPKLGYFVGDIERAGPYSMMAEAMAMANGNPTHIGYLSGGNFGRGFPEYVRAFNTAFLSLPALPSVVVPNAASDTGVVVRSIKTPAQGTYLAIVNTAMGDKKVSVTLPATGKVTNAATGEALQATGNKVQLSLYPFQLQAIRIQ